MKKTFAIFLAAFSLLACSKESIQGKQYKLLDGNNDLEITIGFDKNENRYFGGAVNRYMGTYTSEGDKINLGNAATTMMMAPPHLMDAEMNYLKSLAQVKEYKLKGRELILILEDGKELKFEQISHQDK